MADIIEYFFSGGKNGVYAQKQKEPWNPGLMAISVDGAYQSLIRHPLRVTQIDNKSYWGMVIGDCKKNRDKNAIFLQMAIKLSGITDLIKKREGLKEKI